VDVGKTPAMMAIFESNKIYFQWLNLNDMFAEPLIRQLLNMKKAWTPDYCARRDVGIRAKHHSMRDIGIRELMFHAHNYPGIPTPGAGTAIYMGLILRAGLPLCIGAIKPKPLPSHLIDYVLWKSEVELRFEEIRRQIAPNAVSRLNCLYLADDIEVIKCISQFDPKDPIIKVRIRENSLVTKVDMNLFNDFCNSYKQGDKAYCEKYAKSYWKYDPYKSGNCRWEYLIDGIIDVVGGLDDLREALNEHDEKNDPFQSSG
jgi:hypothetical protein